MTRVSRETPSRVATPDSATPARPSALQPRPPPPPPAPATDTFVGPGTTGRSGGASSVEADGAATGSAANPFDLVAGRYADAVGLPQFLTELGSSPQGRAFADKMLGAFEAKTGVAVSKKVRDAALANPALLTKALVVSPSQMSKGMDALNAAYRAGKLPETAEPARTLPSGFDFANLSSLAWSRPKAQMKELAPGLVQGDLPSATPDERVKANMVTAEVFDRLASNEGLPPAERFAVRYGGRVCDHLEDLLDALRKDGHEVTVSFEQRVANFSNLKTQVPGSNPPRYLDVPAPVMVKTGLKDEAGREALIPSVHGEMLIHIRKGPGARGPGVDADVKFYQGVSGTGFFPCDVWAEPSWCGRTKNGEVSGDDAARAVRLAARFSRLVHDAAKAENLWCGGYGITGVCNDSVAVVQQALTGSTTMYPLLMRDESLMGQVRSRLSDQDVSDDADYKAIRKGIRALPTDVRPNSTARERALACLPWMPGTEPFESSVEARAILGSG